MMTKEAYIDYYKETVKAQLEDDSHIPLNRREAYRAVIRENEWNARQTLHIIYGLTRNETSIIYNDVRMEVTGQITYPILD